MQTAIWDSRVSTEHRPRPLWLVGLLAFLFPFGTYAVVWLTVTWRELKEELNADGPAPIWHGLGSLVPVYGLLRVHAHYQALQQLGQRAHLIGGPRALTAVLAFAIVVSLGAVAWGRVEQGPIALSLAILAGAMSSAVVVDGQATLNAYYAAMGHTARPRVRPHEWLLLALGAYLFGWLAFRLFGLA